MHSYFIWTIGCQMNQAESEKISERLRGHGYIEAPSINDADIVIVNSCVVRKHAEDKVINKLHNLKPLKKAKPNLRIILTGCFVDQDSNELRKQYPYVDDFLKPGEFPDWLPPKDHPIKTSARSAVSAYIPIIQGCNNFCTYCIVPYRRGREKSRTMAEIVTEVEQLAQIGIREVTLVGQNVDSYGHDLPEKPDLAMLLTQLNQIKELARIRFLTNHPKDMSPRLIEAMRQQNKVCRQINLPVQSGDDEILRAMHRGYQIADYYALINRLRQAMPDIAITTDIIVGFPGESEHQFHNTCRVLEELRFDAVHVASYSPRIGTYAASHFADNVEPAIKKARLNTVETLQEQIAREINSSFLGQTLEVLVDGMNKGRWQGRTRSDKTVFFGGTDILQGKVVNVTISKTGPWSFQGTLAPRINTC
ncbi:MAG: MiaB/RimO family radical SAM methylthiotransferase [Dehalococcoidia bacterium]|nr:MiaB/RimO family radical SAM methylthiotransferase [Dehalococcoidia bacterium]